MSKETDKLIYQLSEIIVNLERISDLDNQILADHRLSLRLLVSKDNGLSDATLKRIKEIACLTEDGFVCHEKIARRF